MSSSCPSDFEHAQARGQDLEQIVEEDDVMGMDERDGAMESESTDNVTGI